MAKVTDAVARHVSWKRQAVKNNPVLRDHMPHYRGSCLEPLRAVFFSLNIIV